MPQENIDHFFLGSTGFWMNAKFENASQILETKQPLLLVDENVYQLHFEKFLSYQCITIPSGEEAKIFENIAALCLQLSKMDAHKATTLVAVGGGVVTDIVGFLAGIYMRGLRFGFVPTTLLAMVDAAIGGKNGVNLGLLKNQLGLIRQPNFILYDIDFLNTLPHDEWSSAMAEIIKYSCILDADLFCYLEKTEAIESVQKDPKKAAYLISKCVQHKNKIVQADEQETGIRKILNFGHTVGHAFENLYRLKHGQAIAFGMIVACIASEIYLDLDKNIRPRLVRLLQKFQLKIALEFDLEKVLELLKNDKKRNHDTIDFILIERLGQAQIFALSFSQIREALIIYSNEY